MAPKNKPQTDNTPFFIDGMEDQPQQNSFVLDFTKPREADELIPDGTTANMSISSAKASNFNDVLQLSIRWNVVDGDYEGRGFFENIRLARVLSNGQLEAYYDSTGKPEIWKMARLLDGIQYEGDRTISGVTEAEILESLNALGEQLKNQVAVVTVNVWGDGTRIDPQTGEAYPKRNGVKRIQPFGSLKTSASMFNS